MREGWEIRPLEDCITFIKNGANIKQTKSGLGYPITRIETLSGGKFNRDKMGYADIFELGKYSGYVLNDGDILLSHINSKSYVGRSVVYSKIGDEVILHGMNLLRIITKKDFSPFYFQYYSCTHSFKKQISSIRKDAVNQSSVAIGDLRRVSVPVPSIREQKKIVAELDCLTGIIEKKKQQLKELDNLAQSIFYDMFGDPITNEKGWEKATMDDVCRSMTKGPFGSDIKKSLYVPKSTDTYKVYIQANAIEKDITLGNYYISKQYFDDKMHRFEVHPGDYIITCDGTLGKYIRLPEGIERGIISASLLRITLNERIATRFFEGIWENYVLQTLSKDIRNTALVHLPAASKIGKVHITLPPLDLQNEFAHKIETIEKQKELIKKSIAETETLFNSRMDYWFN